MRTFTILLIVLYQRYISPYKGFRCAHAVWHRGPSCSAAVRAIVERNGVWRGLPLIRLRFTECRSAALHLQQETEEERRRRWQREAEEDARKHEEEERRRRRARWSSCCVSAEPRRDSGCSDVGCFAVDSVECCGEAGSGVDCSALDCSGADCAPGDCSVSLLRLGKRRGRFFQSAQGS